MESAGVGDLGVEIGDLGHRLLPEPPPGGSCGRGDMILPGFLGEDMEELQWVTLKGGNLHS